jgi:deoxyribonucleoside regulator
MSAESLSPRLVGDSQRDDLMVQVAKLYYELEKTQSDISKETGLTRWQVSRLLREARDCGVVRIDIVAHSARVPALEVALQKRFGLREALVLEVEDDDALNVVTQAAAHYLCNLQPMPALIGVSWGRTLTKMAQWLVPRWNEGVNVVLLNGAINTRSMGSPVITSPNVSPRRRAVRPRCCRCRRSSVTPIPARR